MMKVRHVRALAIGSALDLALGDPPRWPHPVQMIGKQIQLEERLIRAVVGADAPNRPQVERMAGVALAATVALAAPLAVFGSLRALDRVHPVLSLAAECALCYQLLAARSLADAGRAVYEPLAAGDVEAARVEVAQIVGRDVNRLDEAGIARAAVETVAENASDGVVAPMLYQALGGAPAMMFYKAVNTLDSMVGYKNDRYLNLGWSSARLDDVLNFVPARATGALMCAAAPLVGLDGKAAWLIFKRDRRNHASPNSAHAEAACAGALGVQLGGPARYFGTLEDKPTIGDAARAIVPGDIPRAIRLMYATAALALAAFSALGCLRRARAWHGVI